METLASRRRQLMSSKSFRGTRKKIDSHNGLTIPIKMGSQSFKLRQGPVCSPVVQRNKIQTSPPCLMRGKMLLRHGVSEKQNSPNITNQTNFICDDLRRISKSLDCLKNDIMVQHHEILRDVESKISSVNNGIISDIDRIRENLHSLESIVPNRDTDSSLNSAISNDDFVGEFNVKSAENLVSTVPWSPSSLISSPGSFANMFSPGSKSLDSGIFFDENRTRSCESTLKSPLKDGYQDDTWRISSGSNYTDVFDRFSLSEDHGNMSASFQKVDQQQCHGYYSEENLGTCWYRPVNKTLEDDADTDDSCAVGTATIQDFPANKYDSTTHFEGLPQKDKHYSEHDSGEDEQTILNTNIVDIEQRFDNCSIDKYSSKTCLKCLPPKEDMRFERGVDEVLYKAEHGNCNCAALCKSYNLGAVYPESTLSDRRRKISRDLSTRCFCQEHLTFDEELQLKIDANQNFREDMVRSHNAFRIYHGSQDLVEADDLTRDAQMWADIIAEKSFLQYSELPGRGENVAFLDTNGQSLNAADVTKIWYEQKTNYDFNAPKWRKDSMNFTQLVWKSTSDIGIGIAKIKGQDRCVVVAQYRPAGNGNMPGEFRKNVLPLQ